VRRDQQERPELRHGSVDFAAPSTFNNRATPQAPIHVFLVDVSFNAVANGSLEVRCFPVVPCTVLCLVP
jgi:hypothetical protein